MAENPSEGAVGSSSRFQNVGECLYRNTSSGVYYGLIKRNGKQFRRSLKTSDRALAKRRLREFQQKLGVAPKSKAAVKVTFAELVKRWLPLAVLSLKPKSRLRREGTVIQLNYFFGQKMVRNITRADCDTWAAQRSADRSASTYNKERETLKMVLDYAQREGIVLDNPASHLPRRKLTSKIPEIPTRAQFQKLVKQMRDSDSRSEAGADLVELLAHSGMRLGEAVNFEWSEIDFRRGTFLVTGGEQGTKNNQSRVVPLFPAMRSVLQRLKKKSKPDAENVVSIGKAIRSMASAAKKAELPVFSHHSMRHFFASNAIEKGIDFKVIAAWLGHSDGGLLVAKTYGHLRDAHSFEMAKRMDF